MSLDINLFITGVVTKGAIKCSHCTLQDMVPILLSCLCNKGAHGTSSGLTGGNFCLRHLLKTKTKQKEKMKTTIIIIKLLLCLTDSPTPCQNLHVSLIVMQPSRWLAFPTRSTCIRSFWLKELIILLRFRLYFRFLIIR